MAYEDFVKLYAADVKSTPSELLKQQPLSFPLSTLQRGDALIHTLDHTIELDLRGKRVLDVGCAYGGFSIAMAKAGAQVIGIDINPRFIDYARANANGVADIDFQVADASSVDLRKAFPKGSFDFLLLNDVLEHIYDTASLVSNLDWLLNDTGIVFFKVPNGLSPRFILSEGHRRIFGLTVLDPDCWFYLHPKRASIFYRPLSHFQAIFGHFGMSQTLLMDDERVFARMTLRKLKTQIKEIFTTAKELDHPEQALKIHLRQGILRFRNEFVYDLETRSPEFVQYKYGSYFFSGFFARPGATLSALTRVRQIEDLPPIVDRPSGEAAEAA
jgi:2-polyprenyl-3-methyl-5-hydroxy-6-metoxy-1,4-benzoquinol methylase